MIIFISYRRADSAEVTHRIYDVLADRYGQESVFKDIDSIPPGVDFRQHIAEALADCRIFAAVIGAGWLDTRDGKNRRLDDDYVRIEIETALGLRIPIIPVLVGKASMPHPEDLPTTLRPLANYNAFRLRLGADFEQDLARLMHVIEPYQPGVPAGEAGGTQPEWRKRILVPLRRVLNSLQGRVQPGRLCPYCGQELILADDPSDPTMLRCTAMTSYEGRCTFRILRRFLALPWLNFSVISYGDASKDLWFLQVWGQLLRGIQTPSAYFLLARTGEENRQLGEYCRLRNRDNNSPFYWHPVTSEAVFLECITRRLWRETSLLAGLLNYPQGELFFDTMGQLARVHALATSGIIFFLDAGKLIRGEVQGDHLAIVFHRLVEDYRFTVRTRSRPFAICLAWREEIDDPNTLPAVFLEKYHALQNSSVTLQGIEEGHRLCLEHVKGLHSLTARWQLMGPVQKRNPLMLFPIMLPNTAVGAVRRSEHKHAISRLLAPVIWLLYVHKHLQLPDV
jgi:hypothetical protein